MFDRQGRARFFKSAPCFLFQPDLGSDVSTSNGAMILGHLPGDKCSWICLRPDLLRVSFVAPILQPYAEKIGFSVNAQAGMSRKVSMPSRSTRSVAIEVFFR